MTPWALISPARLAGTGLLRTQSDARLVDLVRAGNDRAFEAIVHRYHRPLMRHCRRLLPAVRAEDAVQQSLLRALEAMRADRRELQLGPWLHRIAHNTAIDSLRRMDSHWEELDDRIDGVEPTHAAVERRARFRSVVAEMGALPERQRRALVLRELEGRSYEEIAATLGVSGAGVRQLLNRARNAMRAGASALVPTALVGRLAGSQAGARIAELADAPGTSALVTKGTAAVAAGTIALMAVSAPADHLRSHHAHARSDAPALERPVNGGGDSADGTAATRARTEPGRSGSGHRRGRHGAGSPGGPAGGRSVLNGSLAGAAEHDGDHLDQAGGRGVAPSRRAASVGAGKGGDGEDGPRPTMDGSRQDDDDDGEDARDDGTATPGGDDEGGGQDDVADVSHDDDDSDDDSPSGAPEAGDDEVPAAPAGAAGVGDDEGDDDGAGAVGGGQPPAELPGDGEDDGDD